MERWNTRELEKIKFVGKYWMILADFIYCTFGLSLNDRASHSRYFSDELDAQFFCKKKNVCLQNKISMVQFVHNTK